MKRRLLLSGPIGCGKSTLIRNTPGIASMRAGGFVTERVTDRGGALSGFALLPACALACPERRCEAFSFLTFGAEGAARDDGVFRTEAARLLREAEKKPFAVLDEFGGFELLVPEFSAALEAFLSGPTPCVGVLKAPPAADALARGLALREDFSRARERLRAMLESDPDTLILPATGRGDAAAEKALREWAARYAREKEGG